MRLVLDSNVVISAPIWRGRPSHIIDLAGRRMVQLFTSDTMLAELDGVVRRQKFQQQLLKIGKSPDQVVFEYRLATTVVSPAYVTPIVDRDPDDDHVIAAAVGAKADAIISGDHDLTSLAAVSPVEVLSVGAVLARLSAPLDRPPG